MRDPCPASGDPIPEDAVTGDWVCRPPCPTCGRTVIAVRHHGRLVISRHRDRRPEIPMTVTTRRRLARAGGDQP